ncbi:MAG TPA: class I adenylate-forming enzyme family protein [Tepidisphaeraceae bacterium]|jgi:acyl-CoA synthetase (AMP-forming)/AMP-acid ligase II|nr:class I adenylate-forming enzyme family protein [Tepidisphaeraceae bacterium]
MFLTLIENLHSHARKNPGAIAIRQIIPENKQTTTWEALRDRAAALSKKLSAALPDGAVVMLCSANRAEFTAAFLGVLSAGMHVFPIATDIASPELSSAAGRSGAVALICIGQPALAAGNVFSRRREMPECAPDALFYDLPAFPSRTFDGPGLLLLSSGTTGRPKIVRRDGGSLDAVSRNMVDAIGFSAPDIVLAAVPLCHSYGMEHGLLCPIWAGSTTHLYDRFDLPAALAELSAGSVTVFPGVPFMFETLAGGAGDAPLGPLKLRRAYSAGGALPRSLFDAFAAKFGVSIAQLYGATEIGSVCFNDPAIVPFDPASVGRAMQDVSIRILDAGHPDIARPLPSGVEGHVAIAGPSMLAEYVDGDPPELLAGHFLTGDLGRRDESGALTITGRIKLLIDVAGRKVNPLEVEQVMRSHPTVGDCVVVPLRVSQTLCRLRAVVTPARPDEIPTVADLRQFARAHLSAYKVPRIFEIRASLPRSAAGKILRNVVENETAETDQG